MSGGYHPTYAMQMTQAPFTDNNVRLALKYAINRQELVDRVLRGHGTVANDHPIAPTMPFYDASIEQRQYDPDRAKYHIKEAGLDSLKVSLSVADSIFAGAVDSVVLYREHAAAAGIDLEVVREPADGYWSDVWLKKPFVTSAWGARPVPDMILSTAYQTGGAWNETQFSDEKFMQLMVAARSELDQAKRAQMYSDIADVFGYSGDPA